MGILRRRQWSAAAGYVLCTGVLAGGYYYNLTFVQLGLIDLAVNRIGMSGIALSSTMALFAFGALATSLVSGRAFDRTRAPLRRQMQILTIIVALQTALTWWAPAIDQPAELWTWTLTGSVSLGVGIPITFGLMGLLIPVRDRGLVAAIIAGVAFAVAAIYPSRWEMAAFSRALLTGMIPATLLLGAFAFGPFAIFDRMDHRVVTGRFRTDPSAPPPVRFGILVVLMFSVFFIDSLGFLRLIEIPAFIGSAWQSTEIGPRLFIAAVHLLGAAIAGVLYTNFDLRWTLLAVLALFSFSHLLYTFHLRFAFGDGAPLVMPMVYVLAVSFYTTVNFAVWADVSDSADIGIRTAIGVGVAGWLASFLSTAAAIYSETSGVPALRHLDLVEALALALVFSIIAGWFFGSVVGAARQVRS